MGNDNEADGGADECASSTNTHSETQVNTLQESPNQSENQETIHTITGSQIVCDAYYPVTVYSSPLVSEETPTAPTETSQKVNQKRKSKKKPPKTNSEIIRKYLPKPMASSSTYDPVPGPSNVVQYQNATAQGPSRTVGNQANTNFNPVVTEMLSNILTKSKSKASKQNRQFFFGKNNKLSEESKAKIETTLEEFMRSHNREFTFQPDLTSAERKWLHNYALKFGMKSSSHGEEPNRRITLTKKEVQQKNCVPLILAEDSIKEVNKLLRSSRKHLESIDKNPNKWLEISNLAQPSVTGAGFVLTPHIPPQPKWTRHTKSRQDLPIFDHRDEIIHLLFEQKAQIICVKGATGSGKTTQVPQFILEESHNRKMPVQIASTVPRRIAAISLVDRVAEERGEVPGSVVGYSIRFESNVSSNCLLTFCTTGVLLRWLSSCNPASESSPLHRLTHLILDEVHERDKLGDFLITILKRVINLFPNLQLIIMGADLNLELFTTYFGGTTACPVLNVQGRLYPINTFFLEDFLALEKSGKITSREAMANSVTPPIEVDHVERTMTPDPAVQEALDQLFDQLILDDDEKYFQAILYIFTKYRVSYNYQHSVSEATLLSILKKWDRPETVKTLKAILRQVDLDFSDDSDEDDDEEEEERIRLEEELKRDLLAYRATHPDSDVVDSDMMMRIISYIHETRPADEAILVFLPGFEDLCNLSRKLRDELNTEHIQFVHHLLHSTISSKDQKAAFKKPNYGTRKILISTNISETSLTFDDVVHVIDSGRVKEKSYNSASRVSTLQNVWISKASANQRQGRAGRCRQGWCYRLYTRTMFDSFKEFTVPELLRLSLSELCLAARNFVPLSESVASLFRQTPEPPAEPAVNNAIDDLKCLGAFTDKEELTPLGHHSSQLPVDPNLGKALILSVIFRCLDPVLTIVAFLSHRDPFIIPVTTEDKEAMKTIKRNYAMDPFSDLSVLPRLFQEWERCPRYGVDAFCYRSFLSTSAMIMISSIRRQLLRNLGQIRFINNFQGSGDISSFNFNSKDWNVINGVLTSCLLPNVCEINRSCGEILNGASAPIRLHPSSITDIMKIMNKILFDWIVYTEMSGARNGVTRIKDCATTTTAALLLWGSPISNVVSGEDFNPDVADNESYVDLLNWVRIKGETTVLTNYMLVRKLLTDVLNKFYCFPGHRQSEKDILVLSCVKSILQYESKRCFQSSGN